MSPIFKLYDLSRIDSNPRQYWDKGMHSLYFQHPEQFLGRILNSPIYSFLNQFLPKQGIVLDGGCGSNHLSKIFSNKARCWIGLDFALDNLIEGRKIFTHTNSVAGDLCSLPFRAESFNAVVSVSSFEHIEAGIDPLLKETFRVLKPGGTLLLLTPTWIWEDHVASWLQQSPAQASELRRIPHFTRELHFKKVKKPKVENQVGFFAYWYSRSYLRNVLHCQGFKVKNQMGLDLPGGLLRSRLFKPFGQRLFRSFPISKKRLAPELLSRSESIFIREDIFSSKMNYWIHRLVGSLYHYLLGIVAVKQNNITS